MEYTKTLKDIETKIEILLEDMITNNVYQSPRTEERLIAYCLGRNYIKDKIKEQSFIELSKINAEMINDEMVREEQNEQ